MSVTPKSDYWRISHYGFTVDDAPFYYSLQGGEFETKVKISADYKVRFDQSGLMLRVDHENYIKAGIEYVDGKYSGVKEQGLAVLATAGMPAVLTEIGFISNPDEEEYMISDSGQKEIVENLFQAIKTYKNNVEK